MKRNFKDFWTVDMKQFYDESWGQENFNHKVVQSSMPVASDKWRICLDDQPYRQNERNRGPLCMNCKERGHKQYECLKQQEPKCSICGLNDHFYHRCPSAVCTTCRSATRFHTTSCYNCRRVRFMQCSICKATGHEMKYCPDLWRRYHQTTEYCDMLGQSEAPLKKESNLWCSNCAKRGHSADKCRRPHQDRVLSTTKIICYEASYTNDLKLEEPVLESTINAPKKEKNEKNLTKKADKYRIILEKLKKKCNKYNSDSLELVERYLNDIKNNEFSRKKLKKVNKLRNDINNSILSTKRNSCQVTSNDFNSEQSTSNQPKKDKSEVRLAKKAESYQIILEKLKEECKSDSDSLELIERHLDDIKNNKFTRKKLKKVYKFLNKMKSS